jgi:hypothetical protein
MVHEGAGQEWGPREGLWGGGGQEEAGAQHPGDEGGALYGRMLAPCSHCYSFCSSFVTVLWCCLAMSALDGFYLCNAKCYGLVKLSLGPIGRLYPLEILAH